MNEEDEAQSPEVLNEIPTVISIKPPNSTSDRPNLFPTQRRLRHVRGVCCRNISLKPQTRPRSSTQDDDTLRTSWQSPSKLLSQVDGPHTSMSSSDLKDMAKRPKTIRRRATRAYHLGAVEDSISNQKKWEQIVDQRLIDVFFTIHLEGQDEPLYISEEILESMNPNFADFDLLNCDDDTLRLNALVIRIYAKHHTEINYSLLIDYNIALCCLQYIGKDIGQFLHPFPENTVVIQLTDGFYTTFNDVVSHHHPLPSLVEPDSQVRTTFSYSTILKLLTLEDVIRDTLHSRDEIISNIQRLLDQPKSSDYAHHISEAKQSLAKTQSAVQTQRQNLQAARKRAQSLRTSIQIRKESMHKGLQVQAQSQNQLLEQRQILSERKATLKELAIALQAQRRRICLDLQTIYPIEPVDDETLRFTIRQIWLPISGEFENCPEEEIATALGWTAHLAYLLSLYLGVPLRYPVQPIGGRSLINDPVSVIMGSRTFPLYAPGSDPHRFDYAVFLLNKDIEQLMNSQVLHVMNLRPTLANLKYLMLYLTAQTSAMTPPPQVRSRRSEAIPVKKVLSGMFDGSGASSVASSASGNGTGSVRTGIGRFFGAASHQP